jgi:hypothetical protein
VAVARVLDGEIVQAELALHLLELFGGRVLERDPDEAARPLDVLADVVDRTVGKAVAVVVGDAVDRRNSPARPGRSILAVAGRGKRGESLNSRD